MVGDNQNMNNSFRMWREAANDIFKMRINPQAKVSSARSSKCKHFIKINEQNDSFKKRCIKNDKLNINSVHSLTLNFISLYMIIDNYL